MERVKIKMVQGKLGSDDGFSVKMYEAGETYEVCGALADAFVADKVAELVVQAKADKAAPKNKADKAGEDKGE